MTFVIITGGIDLSVGLVMAFTGILAGLALAAGMSPLVVVPTVLLVGALIGLLIGVLVVFFDVQPFIASLAGLFLARGLAFVVEPGVDQGGRHGGAVAAVDEDPVRGVVRLSDRHPGAGGGWPSGRT